MTKQKLWVLSNLSDFMSRSVLDFCLLILVLSPIYRKFSQETIPPGFSLMSNSGNWSLRPKWFLPQNPSGSREIKLDNAQFLNYIIFTWSHQCIPRPCLLCSSIYSPISLDRMENSKVIVYRDWGSQRQVLKLSFGKWSNRISLQSGL